MSTHVSSNYRGLYKATMNNTSVRDTFVENITRRIYPLFKYIYSLVSPSLPRWWEGGVQREKVFPRRSKMKLTGKWLSTSVAHNYLENNCPAVKIVFVRFSSSLFPDKTPQPTYI